LRALGLVSAVLVVSAAACAGAPVSSPPPSASASAAPKAAAVPADIVRSGTIVVGLPANPVLTTGKDPSGSPRGVAPDVINALAARMGVKVTWLDVTDNAKALRDIESGALDVLLISPDAAGADALAFVGYLEIDHTLLVPNGSAVKSFADADKPGVKIWVFKGAPVERTLGRAVKAATVVVRDWPTIAAFNADLQAGGWDAYAQNRQALLQLSDQIKGSRVLVDRFGSTVQSMGVKKGRAELLAYLNDFVVEAKYSGLIKRSIETFKIQGVQPAP